MSEQLVIPVEIKANTSQIRDIPSLDGLRGIAVLAVVIYHFCYILQHISKTSSQFYFIWPSQRYWEYGATGVHLFFVLSGFLLFMPYARALLGLKKFPATRQFYIRRALRILPGYWTALVLILFFLQPNFPSFMEPKNQGFGFWRDFGLHIFLIHNWDEITSVSIDGPFWTLALEFQFYLVLPWLAKLMYWLVQKKYFKRLWTVIGLGFASTPLFALATWYMYTNAPNLTKHFSMFWLIGYFDLFAFGMTASFLYIFVTETQTNWYQYAKSPVVIYGLFGFGLLVLLSYGVLTYSQNQYGVVNSAKADYWLVDNTMLGCGYSCLLLAAVLGSSLWQKFLAFPVLRFVGIISYSLYIWHFPIYEYFIIPFVRDSRTSSEGLVKGLVATLVLLFPVGVASYWLVERPFMRLRRKQH